MRKLAIFVDASTAPYARVKTEMNWGTSLVFDPEIACQISLTNETIKCQWGTSPGSAVTSIRGDLSADVLAAHIITSFNYETVDVHFR